MKEIPILFNAEMVRAILEGKKTQTRRPVKMFGIWGIDERNGNNWPGQEDECGDWQWAVSPFGSVGDHLWVRETWGWSKFASMPPSDIHNQFLRYRANGDTLDEIDEWTPSIHMPRWASRITLEVTDIRVQRVQEISEEDAMAEGVDLKGYRSNTFGISGREHRIEFSTLWQSIYGTWDANPWVWAATFEVVK